MQDDSFKIPLLKDFLIPLSEVAKRSESPGVLFHYTSAHQLKDIAVTHDYESEFRFLRKINRVEPIQWNLYLSADTSSIKDYGPIQIQVKLEQSAYVFDPLIAASAADLALPGEEKRQRMLDIKVSVTDRIENELLSRYPDLGACVFQGAQRKNQHAEDYSVLSLLALQEYRVALIAYYGFLLTPPPYWFALIDAKFITDWRVGSDLTK